MKFQCLVIEPVTLIADDLAALVEEVAPGTPVLIAASIREAEDLVSDWHRIAIAFVGIAPADVRGSALGLALAEHRVTVVYLGHEQEANAIGDRYLERPFAGMAVKSEIDQVWQSLMRRCSKPELAH